MLRNMPPAGRRSTEPVGNEVDQINAQRPRTTSPVDQINAQRPKTTPPPRRGPINLPKASNGQTPPWVRDAITRRLNKNTSK